MADDKKNIPDAGKVDEPPRPGKVESVRADSPVQDQPAPAKAEAPVVEDVPKVVTPPAAEQPALADKEVSKDKGAPAPSKEGVPPPGKDEKQATIPGMGDPAPAGKVVDFTAARDGATKGKLPEKAAAQDKDKQADKAKDAAKPRRGRPPKAGKAAPDKAKPQPRDKMSQSKPPAGKGVPAETEAPAATEQPPAPRDATRGVKEEIVYLNLSELHPFKNHPFGVRDDAEMQGLVESVKAAGVNQPALVRPREGGGYEIIAGHRRQRASELAGFVNMPCIVRNMTDDEAKAIHALKQYICFLSKPICSTNSILFDSINLDDSVGAPLEKAAYSQITDSISENPAFVALVSNTEFQEIIGKIRALAI